MLAREMVSTRKKGLALAHNKVIKKKRVMHFSWSPVWWQRRSIIDHVIGIYLADLVGCIKDFTPGTAAINNILSV